MVLLLSSRSAHRFVSDYGEDSYANRLAREYDRRLVKDYVLADLRKGRVGFRWRTEKEVIIGKGKNQNLQT